VRAWLGRTVLLRGLKKRKRVDEKWGTMLRYEVSEQKFWVDLISLTSLSLSS